MALSPKMAFEEIKIGEISEWMTKHWKLVLGAAITATVTGGVVYRLVAGTNGKAASITSPVASSPATKAKKSKKKKSSKSSSPIDSAASPSQGRKKVFIGSWRYLNENSHRLFPSYLMVDAIGKDNSEVLSDAISQVFIHTKHWCTYGTPRIDK